MGTGASAYNGPEDKYEELEKTTTFNRKQLQRLWKRFNLLDSTGNGIITREEFRLLPELSGNPLADRILDCVEPAVPDVPEEEAVHESSGNVDFSLFVRALDVFCTSNSKQKKIEMLFKMYDVDRDGKLSENDLRSTFQRLVGVSTSRQQVEAMVKAVLATCDEDGDETLSLAEFAKLIDEDDLHSRMTLAI